MSGIKYIFSYKFNLEILSSTEIKEIITRLQQLFRLKTIIRSLTSLKSLKVKEKSTLQKSNIKTFYFDFNLNQINYIYLLSIDNTRLFNTFYLYIGKSFLHIFHLCISR